MWRVRHSFLFDAGPEAWRLTPERHVDTRHAVKSGEAPDGTCVTGFPQSQLAVAHAGETGGGKTVLLSHPNDTAVLGAFMARSLVNRLLLSNIPHAQFLVSRGGDEHGACGVPGQALNDVGVLER